MKSNMYLKMIALVICLLCFISAIGCNSTNNLQGNVNNQDLSQVPDNNDDVSNVQNEDNTDKDSAVNNNANNENPQAVAQPAPPIQAESINEVVSLLVKSDTKGYREELQLQYQELFSRLNKSGFIYQVVTSGNVATKDAITLFERDGKNLFFVMPYAQYEDAGIVSYVMFRGEIYQVCIYNADEKVLPKTNSVSEYIKTRLSIDVSNEMAEGKNTVCFMTEGDGKDYQKNCAAAFIDSNHYYVVKTVASQDQLKAFINVLSFEKMSIE